MKIKFTLCGGLCVLLTLIVIATVLLSSCNDTPVATTPTVQPHVAGTEQRPTATPVPLPSMSLYETGIVAPAWSHDAYSNYAGTLHDMKTATDARWVELPILLQQATSTSTHVDVSKNQVTPESLEKGIKSAHQQGLRVFVVPLMGVNQSGGWAGIIEPTDLQVWFDSYWQALEPYVKVATQAHADQLSIGTEMEWLQNNASTTLWSQLIGRVTSVYHGKLTYDSNWGDLLNSTIAPTWMQDSRLSYIGVSEYIGLVDSPEYVDPSVMPALWKTRVQTVLDAFSENVGKSIVISEIGYRDRDDALYHAWSTTSTAGKSEVEQASAFDAALTDLQGDSHVVGFFPYGWQGVGNMTVKGTKAASTIKQHYQTM